MSYEYRIIVADDRDGFEEDLNHFGEAGWRVIHVQIEISRNQQPDGGTPISLAGRFIGVLEKTIDVGDAHT